MSQIFKSGVGSGNLPGNVPTQFTTDDSTVAVPVANNLNVFTNDTTQNDDNGIQSTASGSTVFIELTNRNVVTAVTSDGGGQSINVPVFTPVNGSAFTFRVLVTGYDGINVEMTGGELIGIARKSGGVVTIILTNDTFDESDPGLAAADYDVVASGADVDVQFIGVGTRTIVWKALFEYVQAAP